jgi:hypothetical protein
MTFSVGPTRFSVTLMLTRVTEKRLPAEARGCGLAEAERL